MSAEPDDNNNNSDVEIEDDNEGNGEEGYSEAEEEVDDAFDHLAGGEHEELLDNMAAVRTTLDKVHFILCLD